MMNIKSLFGIGGGSNIDVHIDSMTRMEKDPVKPMWGRSRYFSGLNPDNKNETVRRNIEFAPPEFDLSPIAALYDIEGSYFRQFVEKIIQRMFRHDMSIVGDERAVKYVKRRIALLESSMDLPFREFLERIIRDLIRYNNCFVEKIRNRKASKRFWRTTAWGRKIPPVVNYDILYAPSVRVAICEHGRVIKYLSTVERRMHSFGRITVNNWQEFPSWNPIDMVHLTIDAKPGHVFGTPLIGPVIDDIRALRTMEEAAEVIVFQYAKPVLLWRLGVVSGKPTGKSLDYANQVLERMSSSGYLVVGHDDEVSFVGANKSTIDITPYLEYFGRRIRTGMGMDPITMGDANLSNRNTAQSLTENMIYLVEFYQRRLKEYFRWYFIREWLQEGKIIGDAEIFFPEIDITAKQTRETHTAFMFMQNMITHEEGRREIGRMPLPDNKDLYIERIDFATADKEAEVQSKTLKVDLKKRSNEVASRVAPTNQYGQKPKPKVKKDSLIEWGGAFMNDKEDYAD